LEQIALRGEIKNKGIQLPMIFALLNPFTAASSSSPWAGTAAGSEPPLKSNSSPQCREAAPQEGERIIQAQRLVLFLGLYGWRGKIKPLTFSFNIEMIKNVP